MRDTQFAVARVTIELLAPLTIGRGGGDDLVDHICVVDANDLPCLPGPSLAGVLRAELAGSGDPQKDSRCRALFGFQDGDKGQTSRVEVSWASAHDANNRPVPFRRESSASNDEVLALMSVGVRRDHVRLTARGAAANRGKFDEALVPRGARFTFEIRVNGRDAEAELENLLNLLAGGLRLGGHTRRGFGSFKLVTVLIGAFDLCRSEDRQRYRRLDRRLDESVPADVLSAWQRPRTLNSHHERIELELTPEDFWLFGGGEPGPFVRGNREPDAAPVTEHMIVWDEQGRGQRSRLHLLVPGSSVKGALLHRTTFHALRLSRRFARSGGELPYDPEKPAHLEEVVALFGEMNDDQSDTGRPGRVIVDDVFLALPAPGTPGAGPRRGWLNHVSIDRFTQAPLDGKLFSESPMFSGKLKLSITVLPSRGGEDDSSALAAFRLAIADLCEGRLALGAAAGRGHGFFSGTVKASTAPWLAGQEGTR